MDGMVRVSLRHEVSLKRWEHIDRNILFCLLRDIDYGINLVLRIQFGEKFDVNKVLRK